MTRSGDFDVLSAAEVEALARAAREGRHRTPPKHPTGLEWRAKLRQQDQQDAAVFLTAAYAGLRLGELRSLRWRDLDFGKRLIHVRHSYVMRNEDAPKSGRVRSIPMIDQVAVALDQLSRRKRLDRGGRPRFRQPGRRALATTMIYVHHVPRVDAAEKLSAALREASTGSPVQSVQPAA